MKRNDSEGWRRAKADCIDCACIPTCEACLTLLTSNEIGGQTNNTAIAYLEALPCESAVSRMSHRVPLANREALLCNSNFIPTCEACLKLLAPNEIGGQTNNTAIAHLDF